MVLIRTIRDFYAFAEQRIVEIRISELLSAVEWQLIWLDKCGNSDPSKYQRHQWSTYTNGHTYTLVAVYIVLSRQESVRQAYKRAVEPSNTYCCSCFVFVH